MPHAQAQLKLREIPGWAVALCLSGLAAGLFMILWYAADPPFRSRPTGDRELRLQFAATAGAARALVRDGGGYELFRDGLLLDWCWLIPAYTAALAGAFGLGHLLLYRKSTRRWALRALILTPVATAADCVENLFLWKALARIGADPRGPLPGSATDPHLQRNLEWASHFAQLKWALLIPLVAAAVLAVTTLCCRRVLDPCELRCAQRDRRPVWAYAHHPAGDPQTAPDVILPPAAPHDWEPRAQWTARDPAVPALAQKPEDLADSASARWRNRAYQPPGRKPGEIGFCVSGGGIRSASIALGALQALRGPLLKADYLVSVSGGGYTAGALQLALTGARPADAQGNPSVPPGLAVPADVFAPGSPEEDHVRRHAKYLADAPKEKLVATGAVLRGMAVSFGMLGLVFAVAGQFLNAFYSRVPLTDLQSFVPRPKVFVPTCPVTEAPKCPTAPELFLPSFTLYPNAWLPVLALLGLAGAASVAVAFGMPGGRSRPAWLRTWLSMIVGLAVAVALLSVVLPAVIWFFAWLAQEQGLVHNDGRGLSVLAALTAAATAVGTWFTVVHRSVKELKPDGEKSGLLGKGNGPSLVVQAGAGWAKAVVCWLVLFLVAFFCLALMSWVAVYSGSWNPWLKAGVPFALLVLALVIDQTTFSLHPFYRQRLASAFAVRRTVLKDGSVGALPYDYNREPTPLHAYAERVPGFPKVIFAASAAVSLRNRTAPGRPAVPFTFASDYCGGPDTGWVRTDTLRETSPALIRRDLTVQSAVAVSGAAFASAMGSQTMFMERLLALSNVRLGTWVPNPLYLAELAKYGPNRIMPRLPRVRRLRYQLQELVGRYSDTTPLLLCTDGGHFDNLGLVEMLRIGCRTVYVIDSSGDTPPLATTLAQAVTLAYEDLGVKITFTDPGQNLLDLVPGSAEPLPPEVPMAALNARFSATTVVRGTIEYPNPVEFSPGRWDTKGTIVFVKAGLTPDMPYELLSYALREKAFPRQATFDQWFDHAQFDAYRALGHHIGTKAAETPPAPPRRSTTSWWRRS
ncbi:patatin-like phospholipase family protein [Streptomyces sp. NPDC090077]|uniref:patatin-like phospholipase family protein n=1 Tax=Streptomyces sp. NPDC090077 TaxID=3365938 RepID=UPI003818784D